jgi:beta-lactamase regulating signal transducer with metallopeptidase domain
MLLPTTKAPDQQPVTLILPATLPTRAIVLGWAAFALAGVLLTLGRALFLSWRVRRQPRCTDARLVQDVTALALAAGVAPPRITLLESGGSPLVAPLSHLCVPQWTLSQLDQRQREAMLAHEIAHVRRRDPLWRVGTELVCCALFFQPLNRLAARRLGALAELACDAWAARVRDPRALAECLIACAEQIHTDAPMLATAMARRRSPLLERIRLLIEETPVSNPLRTHTLRIALALALPAALYLPAIGLQRLALAGETHASIEIQDGLFGKFMSLDIGQDDGSRLRAKVKGDIHFNGDESDVSDLSESAWIEETRGSSKRRIEMEEGKGGAVTRRFYLDGKEQAFDAEAKRWLAQVIPAMMRESGFDAAAREQRIHERGGADAVLDEIAKIHSDYSRRNYIEALAKQGTLTEAQITKAFALVATMGSDYEVRESLNSLLASQTLSTASQIALLGVVAHIDSDYEAREVLSELAPKLALDGGVGAAWIKALSGIQSDYEARVAISTLAERKDLRADLVEGLLQAASRISSDYEMRTALSELAPHIKRTPQLAAVYAKSAASINSDYERREALSALLEAVEIDASSAAAVLDAIAGIGSDYECSTALIDLAARMPADAALIKRYREVARKLGDYERGQAEKALDRFASL